jgi:hypothetical protein
MRFARRNRFTVIFLGLLIFCSAMVVRQFAVNRSRHVELREKFIQKCAEGDKPEAVGLYQRLLRDLQGLSSETLIEDKKRTAMLVDPRSQQQDNLIWRYHWTVRNELERRSQAP